MPAGCDRPGPSASAGPTRGCARRRTTASWTPPGATPSASSPSAAFSPAPGAPPWPRSSAWPAWAAGGSGSSSRTGRASPWTTPASWGRSWRPAPPGAWCCWCTGASPWVAATPGRGAPRPTACWPWPRSAPRWPPTLPVVFAHLGGGLPFYETMPEVQRLAPRLYYDTAAAAYLYYPGRPLPRRGGRSRAPPLRLGLPGDRDGADARPTPARRASTRRRRGQSWGATPPVSWLRTHLDWLLRSDSWPPRPPPDSCWAPPAGRSWGSCCPSWVGRP